MTRPARITMLRRWVLGITALRELGLGEQQQEAILRDAKELMRDDYGDGWPFRRDIPRSPEGTLRRRLAGRLTAIMPFVPATVMLLTLLPFMLVLFRANLGWWTFVLLPIVIVVQLALTLTIMRAVSRRTMLTYVAAALRRRNFDVCMRCGYRLETEGRHRTCPECGLDNPPLGQGTEGTSAHETASTDHRTSAID